MHVKNVRRLCLSRKVVTLFPLQQVVEHCLFFLSHGFHTLMVHIYILGPIYSLAEICVASAHSCLLSPSQVPIITAPSSFASPSSSQSTHHRIFPSRLNATQQQGQGYAQANQTRHLLPMNVALVPLFPISDFPCSLIVTAYHCTLIWHSILFGTTNESAQA
uniref:Uncharacterized protein n=1 Tax=Arundo donax TaxID=35708 RepID=A0A0A9E9W0_ARUDO